MSSDASAEASCASSGLLCILNTSGSRLAIAGSSCSAFSPSSMRSWITIDTQKIISSVHGRVMVESMYNDEVELYFGLMCDGFLKLPAAEGGSEGAQEVEGSEGAAGAAGKAVGKAGVGARALIASICTSEDTGREVGKRMHAFVSGHAECAPAVACGPRRSQAL